MARGVDGAEGGHRNLAHARGERGPMDAGTVIRAWPSAYFVA